METAGGLRPRGLAMVKALKERRAREGVHAVLGQERKLSKEWWENSGVGRSQMHGKYKESVSLIRRASATFTSS